MLAAPRVGICRPAASALHPPSFADQIPIRFMQADFATTAIEFLHRVGRTARAGRAGKVTSLYSKADAVLAEALKQYVQQGKPIEECFSRNRSFSRKVKRYGKFVPRGQEGEQRKR
jgi:superfamily II DNA/RNA helicase